MLAALRRALAARFEAGDGTGNEHADRASCATGDWRVGGSSDLSQAGPQFLANLEHELWVLRDPVWLGLQMANMSAIYEYLGARADQIPILWLAAPLTGLLIQPIIGHASDRTWGRLGRRRPYFLAGAILSSLMLILMPNCAALWMAAGDAVDPGRFDQREHGAVPRLRGRYFAGGAADGGVRDAEFVYRTGRGDRVGAAVAADECGHLQQAAGDARVIPTTVRLSFYIGAAVFLGAVLWTIVTTKEYPPEDLEAFRKAKAQKAGLAANAKEILQAIAEMPDTMRKLGPVQLFTWLGLFCMWLYFPVAVAHNVFGANDPASPL